MADLFFEILADTLIVLPVLGVIATIFLWRVYLSDTHRPRSWILFLLAFGSLVVTIASVAISLLALIRLGGESIGQSGGLMLVIVLFTLELIPVWYAYTIWRVRQGHHPAPRIPFISDDKEE